MAGKRRLERWGYVYVLRAENGLYKIGQTYDAGKRISELRDMIPLPLEVALLFRISGHTVAERNLHKQFAHCRVRGEWFRLSKHDFDNLQHGIYARYLVDHRQWNDQDIIPDEPTPERAEQMRVEAIEAHMGALLHLSEDSEQGFLAVVRAMRYSLGYDRMIRIIEHERYRTVFEERASWLTSLAAYQGGGR